MGDEVVAAVAQAYRRDWAQVFSTTARLTRDLDLAEECTQDAFTQALQTWARNGIPDRPGAWLTTIARNRALDVRRRDSVFRRKAPLLVADEGVPGPEDLLVDDRLRLVFTCSHPALSREARVALTLRLVCGLSTPEVARAFLCSRRPWRRGSPGPRRLPRPASHTGYRARTSSRSGWARSSRWST